MAVALRTIMVVEEDGLLRWSLQRALAGDGRHVVAAPDACTAMGAMPENLDLVILGLKRRDQDGRILLRSLQRRAPSCRVIVTTALANEEELEARKLGACLVLAKPLDLDVLRGEVQHLLRNDPATV